MNLSFADIFIIPLGLIWLIDIKNFKISKHFPHWWFWGAYFFVFLLSGVYNIYSPVNSSGWIGIISEAIKIIICAAFFFVAYNAADENRNTVRNVLIAWTVGLNIFIVYGLYAHISKMAGVRFWIFNLANAQHQQFLGTSTDHNASALYLSVSFFVILIIVRYFQLSTIQNIWAYITVILTFVCIILTMSRGGLIGFFSGIAVLFVFNIKRYYKILWIFPSVLLVPLLFLFIDTRFLLNSILKRFTGRILDVADGGGMLQVRINQTIASIRMGIDNLLLGVGRGNFSLNSQQYILDIIEDGTGWYANYTVYEGLVPHNTIAGSFAELGLLGVTVFLSLFALMGVKILKSKNFDWELKCILFAMWIAIIVQSLSLSLENTRLVWLVLGFVLCLLDRQGVLISNREKSMNGAFSKTAKMVFAVLSIGACLILYDYTAIRFQYGRTDISKTQVTISFDTEIYGWHTLRYHVINHVLVDECEFMEVAIRRASTGKIVNHVEYASITGYASLFFYADMPERFYIDVVGGALSMITDVRVINPRGDTQVLAGEYPLLPKWLYHINQRHGRLISNTADANSELDWIDQGQLEEQHQVNIGGKIMYKGMTVETGYDGYTEFSLTFECISGLSQDFYIWAHLHVDSINSILYELSQSRDFINIHHERIKTSEWQVGTIYTHSFRVNLANGNYEFYFGFWVPPTADTVETMLHTSNGDFRISPGWFYVMK